MSKDNINPDHYKNSTSLECIESMEIIFGTDDVISFCICNAWKYIWRWKNKNGAEDLKKAEWYLNKAKELIGSDASYEYQNGLIWRMHNYLVDVRPNAEKESQEGKND